MFLLALLSACAGDPVRPLRPNLVLISLDSTRADQVGVYGHRPPLAPEERSTPSIDRLAAEGVLFETALATTSWTLPSHVALLTGTPDLVHGVELDGLRMGPRHVTLAEVLARAGYRTTGFFSGPYLEPRFAFDRGFERYRACYGPELTRASTADVAGDPKAERALEVASQRDVSSPAVLAAALAELDQAASDERPFFLFVHFFDPHYDYLPPEPFDRRFDPNYAGALDGRDFYRNPAIATFDTSSESRRVRTVSDRDLAHLKALYSGDLAATDAAVGTLLARLDELGLGQDTVVALVADHGDEFFEHDGIGHRRTLFEEVLRVPFVLRAPGRLEAGTRISAPVSTAAVAATVLDLLGLEAPDSMTDASLAPVIAGASAPPGVLSRLVTRQPARKTVEVGGGLVKVAVERIQVLETFRSGTLKLTRERTWTIPAEDAGDLLPDLLEEARRRRSEERLRWIDLALDPDERGEDHSTDFEDPRARAALDEFRARYALLSKERLPAVLEEGRDYGAEVALRGLGYGGAATSGEVGGNDLQLPPPGDP